jgi:hypothetical protein
MSDTTSRFALLGALATVFAIVHGSPASAQTTATSVPTHITVRVIAVGGKFLGDDVGGSQISIRDVYTGELLAAGVTHGGSGPASLMTTPLTRTQPIPTEDGTNSAARFDATIPLDRARLVEVTAIGPLAAPYPGHVTQTVWLYPGKNLSPSGPLRTDGLLMEMPGLIVGMVTPPMHYLANKHDPSKPLEIRANVTMMCGCPIATDPWPAADFDVVAYIEHGTKRVSIPLHLETHEINGAPSQFSSHAWIPGDTGVFNISVVAYQKSTGNLGVAQSSVTLSKQ